MSGKGVKMPFFPRSGRQGIKTVQARGRGGKKWQNSVHVVVECPPNKKRISRSLKKTANQVLFVRVPLHKVLDEKKYF